jgi:hypothetical protein
MLIAKYPARNSRSRNWDDARLRNVRAKIALLGAAALSLGAQVFA